MTCCRNRAGLRNTSLLDEIISKYVSELAKSWPLLCGTGSCSAQRDHWDCHKSSAVLFLLCQASLVVAIEKMVRVFGVLVQAQKSPSSLSFVLGSDALGLGSLSLSLIE